MNGSIQRQGQWWHLRPDGVWLRWDDSRQAWEEQLAPPPAPLPHEIHAVPVAALRFRPLVPLGGWLIALLVAGVVLDFVSVLSNLAERSLLQTAFSTGVTMQQTFANDLRQGLIALGQLMLFAGTAIVFIVWFHRAYKNLPALGAAGLRFTSGWAIGAWFVPILNLFRPKKIADDIWRASDPSRPRHQGESWKDSNVAKIVGVWWAAWIIASIYGQVAAQTDLATASAEQLLRANTAFMIGDFVNIVVSILAMVFVFGINDRQSKRAAGPSPDTGLEPALTAAA